MAMELNLRFPDPAHVIVRLGEGEDYDETERLGFRSPLKPADQQDLHWYLEVYPTYYTADVDDGRAQRIASRLPTWGAALLTAVIQNDAHARRLFDRFLNQAEPGRLLTVSSSHPTILAQPWELLRDASGTYLVHERPRIAIRRRLAGAGKGRTPLRVAAKDRLRLLLVVSRPKGASFIDPRSDPLAVLDALDAHAPGRVEVEFLRPATLTKLVQRLEDENLPPVDILHFDGHGAFDPDGRLADAAGKAALPVGLAHLVREGGATGNQGYLLFEEEDGGNALISAELLGDMLHRQQVGLVVLSACQSAAVGGEDALGSVAARLTHAGIPTVLAMTHSVLVATTRALFAAFYKQLAQGRRVGESLDDARRQLYSNPRRGERRRGDQRVMLELQDWFLPALYQGGRDTPLLTDKTVAAPQPARRNNLPALRESGFFGRSRELWEIERAFVHGARRLAITGFGGQGKTYLAGEAGRWLQRTGLFERVCLVSYASFQGVDAVGLAVITLATVLERNLLDAGAATVALKTEPVLLILDNLESIAEQPLRELLEAAKDWSEAGASRVLLTTRMPILDHPAYPAVGSNRHRYLPLQGLGEEDALAWFQVLMKLSPEPQVPLPNREALLQLFQRVDFHPLSIELLAQQLKFRRIAELGERLQALLAETPNNPLLASLNLSLERLDPQAREWLPRLGVFQGGAMEHVLQAITELSDAQWSVLRQGLETTGLVQVEPLPGIDPPYLKFHPTLAPALWPRLSAEEQAQLEVHHRQRYYELSGFLYQQDDQHPHEIRAIAWRELPNLLHAVHAALAAGEAWAVEFADNVNRFLDVFGLNRDRAALNQRAAQADGAVGSDTWYLARSNLGEQLFSAGRYQEAEQVFTEVLQALGDKPSYKRCVTLNRLGRCLSFQGQAARAEACYRQGLAVLEQLEPSEGVKGLRGGLQTGLADVLTDRGDYQGARAAYEAALAIAKEQDDGRQIGVVEGQLGTLALWQGNLQEAERRHWEALRTFQRLQEPASEAVVWHQLGSVYQQAQQWEPAERAYRESARIEEERGDLAGAAQTWNQLATVTLLAGKPPEAEGWYRKAIAGGKAAGDWLNASKALSNLAVLLQNQPDRLPEARQLAEEALAIKQTLDPAAATIWTTYNILAEITDKQGEAEPARTYRRQAREAYTGFAGARYALGRHANLIAGVVVTVADPAQRAGLETALEEGSKHGWGNLVAAIRRILDGERDEDALCESLSWGDSPIIHAILAGIEDPDSLKSL